MDLLAASKAVIIKYWRSTMTKQHSFVPGGADLIFLWFAFYSAAGCKAASSRVPGAGKKTAGPPASSRYADISKDLKSSYPTRTISGPLPERVAQRSSHHQPLVTSAYPKFFAGRHLDRLTASLRRQPTCT